MAGRGRRWWALGLVGVLVAGAGTTTFAYLRRIGPQFPATAGTPFPITIAADGCPTFQQPAPFADRPGRFVRPDPVEVVLCTKVDADGDGVPESPDDPAMNFEIPPWRRTLSGPAAVEFAALLNRLPDRNGAWRDWQRRHSGLWPDAPWQNGSWDSDAGCISNLMLPVTDTTFVLRYADGTTVALVSSCHGWTDGTRTRIDITYRRPHLADSFVQAWQAQ